MRQILFDALILAVGLVFAISCLATIVTDGRAAGGLAFYTGLMLFALLFTRRKIQ